jgi:hypothetical protein
MTEREQMQNVCRWNRELMRENSRLRQALGRSEDAGEELRCVNVNLQLERDATDALLGEAMDAALEGKRV